MKQHNEFFFVFLLRQRKEQKTKHAVLGLYFFIQKDLLAVQSHQWISNGKMGDGVEHHHYHRSPRTTWETPSPRPGLSLARRDICKLYIYIY